MASDNKFAEFDQPIKLPDGKQTSFSHLLIIDDANLSKEFADHAAWLGYIGVLTAEAEDIYETAKMELDVLYAEVETNARLHYDAGRVKYTEPMIKAYVQLDSEYYQAAKRKLEALKAYKTLKALEAATKEKGNMLVSLGATMRQELDHTELRLRLKRDD